MTSEIRKTLEPIMLSVIENEKEQQKWNKPLATFFYS
jgi:hypothetical protein